MKNLLARFIHVTFQPDAFFEYIREENDWRKPLIHFLVLAIWLSFGSVIAWGWGVQGDTPLNSALGAQMDIYPYWKDTLLPQYGTWSYPMAMGLIIFEMGVITLIYTPIVFLVFCFIGGERRPHGLLRAFQGFVYGLTPVVFGGFLPGLGLATGVYSTLLQLQRGPSITLKNKSIGAYLLVIAILAYAIAQYWKHALL